MRTILYKCDDYPNNSVCAQAVDDLPEGHKLTGCVGITMQHYSDQDMVYLSREDTLHFAETLKALAEAKTEKAKK